MRITALAGGVGGAKLVNGLSKLLEPENFSVIVNTGDDFLYSGLYVCPDLDTVTYTLAGINDPINGWGLKNETWNVLTALQSIGHPVWFKLGDRDIATHIERTRLLQSGKTLTEATSQITQRLGVKHAIFPMTNEPVRTMIDTVELGVIAFQEYFVRHKFQPSMKSIEFSGIQEAKMPDVVRENLELCDMVIICPSNPFVSIDPILSVPGIRNILLQKKVIAVSPLISGRTIKGPAAKLMQELNLDVNSASIAKYYGKILTGFIIDDADHDESESIRQWGIIPLETDILMTGVEGQVRLARKVLDFAHSLL